MAFLQEVERTSRLSSAEPRQQPGRAVAAGPPVLANRLRKVLLTARHKGTVVEFMPPGMKRHEANTTSVRLQYGQC